MSQDSLGDRMKSYEDCYRTHLPIRMPVIIRVDGKAFHTYTKNCKRPVDERLVEVMNKTAITLCEQVQGCRLAYVQSDEISLLVTNYQSVDTQSWFDNNLQKMGSISSAIASATFTANSHRIWDPNKDVTEWSDHLPFVPERDIRPAYFDSRVFVIPKEDVCNYFLWRQQDATRNSVQMLARSLYSHKECTNLNNAQLQELIFQKGINWNDCPVAQKRGRCIVKREVAIESFNPHEQKVVQVLRSEWAVDNNIPVFSADRSYIDKYV